MFCQKCGHEVQDNASFCPNCGFALKKAPTNGFKLPTISLTKSQQISAIICSIWFIIWIFIRAIAFNRQYDTDEREICLLVAIFIPALYLLVKWLIPLIQTRSRVKMKKDILSLSEFSKQFDGIRIETVFNKLSEKTDTYCVFYNNTRALFGESLNNCSPDVFKSQMKDLVVVQRNGKYVIERKDSVSNDLSNKD